MNSDRQDRLTRRSFLKSSAILGAAIATQSFNSTQRLFAQKAKSDIAVAKGEAMDKTVRAALTELGGMKKFVSKGDRVVLLPNPQGSVRGTNTHPEIIAETIKLCLDAGATEVAVCSVHGPGRWRRTGVIEATQQAGGKMIYPDSDKDWIEVDIPKGKLLKKTNVIKRAIEKDVIINMPIAKHHNSARFTCTLKNLMGFNDNNGRFHQGEAHLHQCIVDLASIFSIDLCIVDATTILIQNGPFGPGKTASPQKVYAGTDMVAIDALCCGLIDIKPQDVGHISGAHKLGLGEIDLSKLRIKEVKA